MTNDDFRQALSSSTELEITFTGRKSGKKFSTPVWFVNNSDKIYLLPVNGTSTNWYRNVVKNPKMELQATGKKAIVEARPSEDKNRVGEIIDRFREKYGASDVKEYYPRPNAIVEISI